jgi:hypothetical protein
MPNIRFFLKVKDVSQFNRVFNQLSMNNGYLKWENPWKHQIAPITEKKLAVWLGIEDLHNLEIFKQTQLYLKEHGYVGFAEEGWESKPFTINELNYSNGLFLDNINNKNIKINVLDINTNEHWVGINGSAADMPFKLIKKICKEEDIIFICRFGDVLLIKIDKEKIIFFDLSIDTIFNKTIPKELLVLDGLLDIEKKELALAKILYNFKTVEFDNYGIDFKDAITTGEILEKIINRIKNKKSFFKIEEEEFKQMCNSYFLNKKLLLNLEEKILSELEKKTKV